MVLRTSPGIGEKTIQLHCERRQLIDELLVSLSTIHPTLPTRFYDHMPRKVVPAAFNALRRSLT